MRPLNLRLRGLKGIFYGMGLDEITLDLSNIKGLIALAGENGSGKTTILENLHPYRALFSHDGSLFNHVLLRDSEKDFTFSHEGHVYRTLLKIDAESERGEGFIWKDGASQVNGKLKEYDKYIENLLGSQFLFQNSVFCAQNSKKLTDLRTGELREMFVEFLRLDRLTGYEATAKQIISVISGQVQQIENRIAGLKERAAKKYELETRLGISTDNLMNDEMQAAAITCQIAEGKQAIEDVKEIIQRNTLHLQRKADIEANIINLMGELNELKFQEEKELLELRKQYADIKGELDKVVATLADREKIEKAAGECETIRAEIEAIEAKLETIAADLAERKEELTGLELKRKDCAQSITDLTRDETFKNIEAEMATLQNDFKAANAELKNLQTSSKLVAVEGKIRQAKDKMKDLDLKDPACVSTTCSFIVGALEAAKQLPELEREQQGIVIDLDSKRYGIQKTIVELEAAYKEKGEAAKVRATEVNRLKLEAEERLSLVNSNIKTLKERIQFFEGALSDARKHLARLRFDLKCREELAARLPEIKTAAMRHDDLSVQLSNVMDKENVTRLAWTQKQTEKGRQIEEKKACLAEILSFIDTTAEQSLKQIQADIATKEKELATAGEEINAKKGRLAGIQAELRAIEEVEKEVAQADTEKGRLTGEASEWTYLRNACSKTGLQALEIDGVCPHIQFEANKLLADSFGPCFSIRIQTQDDEGKEVFRVWVIRESGEEELLEDYSGGEKTWMLKALRLSLTILSKHKSGRRFDAAFGDEETGALDVERAKSFMELYRSFMKAGEFSSLYFISHVKECLGYADHVLTFKKGGIDIN